MVIKSVCSFIYHITNIYIIDIKLQGTICKKKKDKHSITLLN